MNSASLPFRQSFSRRVVPLACLGVLFVAVASQAAPTWTDATASLMQQFADAEPVWPGGCSGVVVNRLTGEVTVKVVGRGLWSSEDQGKTWRRIDKETISGRDETGWATSVDQNNPSRLASFSLDGTAGWTTDGRVWKRFTDLGRNWDYGSVEWSAAEPKTIIGAKHESNPPGEVYLTKDGGNTWKQLSVHLQQRTDRVSMVGALGGSTLIYCNGEGIHRSVDDGTTWTQVSDANAQTRIPVLFGVAHYLGTAAGLLVSRDRGASWEAFGTKVDAWQGPFFGKDEKELLVVGREGVFLSDDAAETWSRVADLKPKEKGFLFTPNWFGCYAWDPVNRILYASSMGNPVHRLELNP